MKKSCICLMFILFVSYNVAANIEITEIMHSPTQTASDTDGEWIELHNNGTEAVNLSGWKIDGHKFGYLIIEPGEYAVVARELTDGSDEDKESFESYWGNNDGTWDSSDGGYKAVDGYFALSEEDTVILTDSNGTVMAKANYSLATGNSGRTIEKVNESWILGWIDGTPGYGYSDDPPLSENEALIKLSVQNIAPEILSITLDNCEENAVIYPEFGKNKVIAVTVTAKDDNGAEDILSVFGKAGNKSFNLNRESKVNSTTNIYKGSFELTPTDPAGNYTVQITVADSESHNQKELRFEYAKMVSAVVETKRLTLTGKPGNSSYAQELKIRNDGNSEINIKFNAADLRSKNSKLNQKILEAEDNGWKDLDELNSSVSPGSSKNIKIRARIPPGTKKDIYTGKINVVIAAK